MMQPSSISLLTDEFHPFPCYRDLKPENILLSHDMHAKISDFGSCKLDEEEIRDSPGDDSSDTGMKNRRQSFVGTAQYVSPEMLNGSSSPPSVDIWAWGCILYQMLTRKLPFNSSHDLTLFRKITQDPPDYSFPDDIDPDGRSLISRVLVHCPDARLGVEEFNQMPRGQARYTSIREDAFFSQLSGRWDTLHTEVPPLPVPEIREIEHDLNNLPVGLDEQRMARLFLRDRTETVEPTPTSPRYVWDRSNPEFVKRLEHQRLNNEYHKFVENNLIIRQGHIDKRRGLFSHTRMFLLTTGPRLYYVDPVNQVVKGQVPLSADLKAEVRSFRSFHLHVPGRTYYLEDLSNDAPGWVKTIKTVLLKYFPPKT